MLLRGSSGRTEKVIKLNVAARGRGNSFTEFARFDDDHYLLQTRGKLMDRLRILCATRASEEVKHSETNTTFVVGENPSISVRS